MKKIVFALLISIAATVAHAQSTDGLTGIRDTSYSIYSAYQSSIKKYPQIKIAAETHSPAVKENYNISFCKTAQRTLMLDAFVPARKVAGKRTAIIILFGGGWRSGNRTMHYPLAQKLAALGYVCFTPDYRLSTEALYPAAVYDVKAALRWVRKNARKYNLDPSKIALLGFSAGGELGAFAGATNDNPAFEGDGLHLTYSSSANAVIDIDGTLSFVHPESGEGDDSKKKSAATLWFGYSKTENPAMWQQASPLTHAGARTPPTLFINSSVDRMHAGRADYVSKLSAYHIYTEVHAFENSPHHFCLFEPWFEPTVNHIDAFLKKVFPAGSSADSETKNK